LGTASTTYISIPDSSATCANLGLPALPSGWTYACSNSTNYRKTNGQGWLPLAFTNMTTKAPFASLPIDPINSTSSNNYYTYTPGASWALSSLLESQKYLSKSSKDDGGYNPGKYEIGTNLSLLAQQEGLVGWWDFEEGSGTQAIDKSGNSNTGTWNGTGQHYTTGKTGSYAGQFNGSDDYINMGFQGPSTSEISGSALTLTAWVKRNTIGSEHDIFTKNGPYFLAIKSNNKVSGSIYNGAWVTVTGTATISAGNWYHLVLVYNGSNISLYVNGQFDNSAAQSGTLAGDGCSQIGRATDGNCNTGVSAYLNGLIDDARIYRRALSATEIKAIYDATK
ncbi:MAG: LamG domain-containing protein, partial [Patescibacteria group bacterium]